MSYIFNIKKGLGSKLTHRPIEKKIIKSIVNSNKKIKARLNTLANQGHIATGYVPYCETQTEIFYYNFFSINYGIRSNIDLVISLTDCDFVPIESKHINVSLRQHLKIDTKNIFSNFKAKKACFVVLFILNNRIPINHGGSGGHLRFFGIWNNFASFCHSWPLPSTYEIIRGWINNPYKRLAERRYYPRSAYVTEHFGPFQNSKTIFERGDLSPLIMEPHGFTVLKDKNNMVRALFHNKGYDRSKKLSSNFKDIKHIVSLPPVKELDIELFFGECCTSGSEFIVNHYFTDPSSEDELNILLSSQNFRVNLDTPSMLSSIVSSPLYQENGSWVEFVPMSGKHSWFYLNLVYYLSNGESICDVNHSHTFNDIQKAKRKARTLKFAPFNLQLPKDNKKEKQDSYLAVWSDRSLPISVRVRILSAENSNFEIVIPLSLKKSSVFHLDLNSHLKNYHERNNYLVGDDYIVQLESEDTNVHANLYHINKNNSPITFAVDHLTGG